jgi:flagellar biosynthesis protein FlhB
MYLLLITVLVAAIDVPLARYQYQQRLKMSHQEIKQEHKESEGSPQMKGKRRAMQREMAQKNSVAAVPKADMVLTNPTHYSVAIQYNESSMMAPRVIAKGADLVAFRIREVAKEHHVPVLQSPMLARALYAHTEIDQEIPSGLYTAVAQVLAYVYQMRAALKGQGVMPTVQPNPDVPVELDPHHPKNQTEV